ncbi:MAG: hypothetical protein EAZ92_16700 [Candidatus Kapaibacterium sp.]|nr:MAG: hypothetical protein EAZ92_16700 [Candidatus Kapabacteria bacterium]
MKSFERWTIDEVEEYFSLHQTFQHPTLEAWLSASGEITEADRQVLEGLRKNAYQNIEFWNEEDLKMKFIAFLLALVPFDEQRYKGFLERTIKATIKGEVISGVVDYVVATGKAEPQVPFFFLQEYKPQRRPGRDALAQVLSAMIAARERNTPQRTMYGSYVIGRQWFFLVLDENTYTISRAFDITQDEIVRVVQILRRMKQIIEEWLNTAP